MFTFLNLSSLNKFKQKQQSRILLPNYHGFLFCSSAKPLGLVSRKSLEIQTKNKTKTKTYAYGVGFYRYGNVQAGSFVFGKGKKIASVSAVIGCAQSPTWPQNRGSASCRQTLPIGCTTIDTAIGGFCFRASAYHRIKPAIEPCMIMAFAGSRAMPGREPISGFQTSCKRSSIVTYSSNQNKTPEPDPGSSSNIDSTAQAHNSVRTQNGYGAPNNLTPGLLSMFLPGFNLLAQSVSGKNAFDPKVKPLQKQTKKTVFDAKTRASGAGLLNSLGPTSRTASKNTKDKVVSITYEEIGLFPRSFSRVIDRFLKQIFSDVENLVIQEYRFYRYLFLTTIQTVFILLFVPLFINFIAKTYFIRPVTEYFWNTKQTEIFLNSYEQKRAFLELQDFEEKLYFESLLTSNSSIIGRSLTLDSYIEKNPSSPTASRTQTPKTFTPTTMGDMALQLANKNPNQENKALDKVEASSLLDRAVENQTYKNQPGPRDSGALTIHALGKITPLEQNGFLPPPISTNPTPRTLTKEILSTNLDSNVLGVQPIDQTPGARPNVIALPGLFRFGLFSRQSLENKASVLTSGLVSSQSLETQTETNPNKQRPLYPLNMSHSQDLSSMQNSSYKPELEVLNIQSNLLQERLQEKTVELAIRYNNHSIASITNFFADFLSLLTLLYLLVSLEIQINITKSFLLEVFFGLDDSKKSLLILIMTDLLVGYHSSNLWELFFQFIFNHYGIPESQTGIFLLVATLPVLLDVLFKYLIFRHLNRASPATVATYHAIIE